MWTIFSDGPHAVDARYYLGLLGCVVLLFIGLGAIVTAVYGPGPRLRADKDPTWSAPVGSRPPGRRHRLHSLGVGLALVAGIGTAALDVMWAVSHSDSPATSVRASVESLLQRYYDAANDISNDGYLSDYWSFPARFYDRSEVADADALERLFGPRVPPSDRRCRLGPFEYVSGDERDGLIRTRVRREWSESESGESGIVDIDFILERSPDSWLIVSMTGPPQPMACPNVKRGDSSL